MIVIHVLDVDFKGPIDRLSPKFDLSIFFKHSLCRPFEKHRPFLDRLCEDERLVRPLLAELDSCHIW